MSAKKKANPWRNRIVGYETMAASRLVANDKNWRLHPKTQERALAAMFDDVGWVQNVVVNQTTGRIVDGHLRVRLAMERGAKVPVTFVKLSEEEEARILLSFDPIGAMAKESEDALAALREQFDADGMIAKLLEPPSMSAAGTTTPSDEAPKIDRGKIVTKKGDLWILGRHRLLCGDATVEEDVRRVCGENLPLLMLTDPPYCSGGFQEAGRAQGSIGTKRKDAKGKEYTPEIMNDKLSTPGYMALMKRALTASPTALLYCFTDWRMWITLYDIAESSGYGVRNMVVWDKGTPGMGQGWRSQHEIVLFGSGRRQP